MPSLKWEGVSFRLVEDEMSVDLRQRRPKLCSCQCHGKLLEPERNGWIVYLGEKVEAPPLRSCCCQNRIRCARDLLGKHLGAIKQRGNRSRWTTRQDWTCERRGGWKELCRERLRLQCSSEQVPSRLTGIPKANTVLAHYLHCVPIKGQEGPRTAWKQHLLTFSLQLLLKGNLSNTSPQPPPWF